MTFLTNLSIYYQNIVIIMLLFCLKHIWMDKVISVCHVVTLTQAHLHGLSGGIYSQRQT